MNETAAQFTKRELQGAIRSPLLWTALGATALVLGLAGPFGTYEALALPARLGYWALVAVATYFAGFAATTLLSALFFARRRSPLRDAALAAASGVPVAALLWVFNLWVFPEGGIGFLPLLGYVCAVAAAAAGTITLFAQTLAGRTADVSEPPAGTPQRPPLLDRLPPALRGRLLFLSMQDHYVEVVTDKGAHLVLMRLSDAIGETGGVEGLQVHRSHWVARAAIRDSVRRGDRMVLRLVNGAELPVSRSNQRAVREAGFG